MKQFGGGGRELFFLFSSEGRNISRKGGSHFEQSQNMTGTNFLPLLGEVNKSRKSPQILIHNYTAIVLLANTKSVSKCLVKLKKQH